MGKQKIHLIHTAMYEEGIMYMRGLRGSGIKVGIRKPEKSEWGTFSGYFKLRTRFSIDRYYNIYKDKNSEEEEWLIIDEGDFEKEEVRGMMKEGTPEHCRIVIYETEVSELQKKRILGGLKVNMKYKRGFMGCGSAVVIKRDNGEYDRETFRGCCLSGIIELKWDELKSMMEIYKRRPRAAIAA